MPATVMGSRKIIIKGGSDVTNQTCLYPGVNVMPGACLGVFTYAEAERTFARDSIVQVWTGLRFCVLAVLIRPPAPLTSLVRHQQSIMYTLCGCVQTLMPPDHTALAWTPILPNLHALQSRSL